MLRRRSLVVLSFAPVLVAAACGGNHDSGFQLDSGIVVYGADGGKGVDGGMVGPQPDTGTILVQPDTGAGTGDAAKVVADPTTCAEAVTSKSYIGCDYWPTVTANLVSSVFDFAAVVANTQTVPATVTITGPNGVATSQPPVTVQPNALATIYLPWVQDLKGPDVSADDTTFANSVLVTNGAYHLVSSVPVTVYQFNALEYQGMGGPAGKDWSSCPDEGSGCFSYSNDASLLLPSTAMTGNYRITGEYGSDELSSGSLIAITGTQDGTMVTVTLSATSSVVASVDGVTIPATGANKLLTFTLNAGDVAELMGIASDMVDLSGSLVYATKPVQVISGRQCANQPDPVAACDHLESSVLPAETLGKDYVVTVPTSPHQTTVGHMVRFYGNVDGTVLTYSPPQPGCPTNLNAGEVGECAGTANCATGLDNDADDENYGGDVSISCMTSSFEVTGTHEFAVTSFMLGGSAVDPNSETGEQEGDPSSSPMVATEQYRSKYVFLAPTDYDESYADVVVPAGATITLDGTAVTASATSLNANWSIIRLQLGAGQGGAHILTGSKAFGVQVIGYGAYTSYQYPAGLDLLQIAPPPPPPVIH
jgi:hypothetical protein